MPTSTWDNRDERQYRAIVRNCRSGLKACKRIAAATVNKRRASLDGLGSDPRGHRSAAENLLQQLEGRPTPNTCKGAIVALTAAARARDAAEDSGDPQLVRRAIRSQWSTKKSVVRRCRETSYMPVAFALEGLERAEMLNTRGFREGNKAWIDVMPMGGPRMRVTHEILAGLGENEFEPSETFKRLDALRNYAKPALRKYSALKRNLEKQEQARAEGDFRRLKSLQISYDQLEEKGLKGLDSAGRPWSGATTAALVALGGAALLALSDKMQQTSPPAPAPVALTSGQKAQLLVDLNRARATQGLPPLAA